MDDRKIQVYDHEEVSDYFIVDFVDVALEVPEEHFAELKAAVDAYDEALTRRAWSAKLKS